VSESAITALLAAATLACLGAFWIAPGGVLSLRRRAGGALQVDLRLGYSADTLYGLLDSYGPSGRRSFRRMLLADMAFPALYGTTLYLCGDLHAVSGKGFGLADLARLGAIAAAAFDHGENFFLLHAVRHWAARPARSARFASTCTTSKVAALALTAVSLAVGWMLPPA